MRFGLWMSGGVVVLGGMAVGAWGADSLGGLVVAPAGAGTLKSGVQVEVMGVTDGETWWTADGVAMHGAPTERLGERAREQKVSVEVGQRVVRVAVRVEGGKGASGEEPSVAVEMDGATGSSSSRGSDGAWEGMEVARVKGETESGTVRVAVAAGKWKTVADTDGRGAESTGDIAMTGVLEGDGKTVVVVSEPTTGPAQERRLELTDKAGKAHASTGTEGLGGTEYRMTIFEFSDVRPADVAKVVYSVRAYDQWVEFRGVALEAGAGGKVEVGTSDGK
ncbi:MAG TPA: hypothetical protein VH253_03760 [Phycisphaerae bacterium]|nr:hypothetical protein [Phycisphaerae bacterium]